MCPLRGQSLESRLAAQPGVLRSTLAGRVGGLANATEDLQVVARFVECVLLFGFLPQGVGLVANRFFARWKPVAQVIGVIAPAVVVIGLWSIVADIDLARQQAARRVPIDGTGSMSGFLVLPPFHIVVAGFAQAFLTYGARLREQ